MTWEAKKQQSIDILDKYKDRLSSQEYQDILWVIGNQALEDIFADEEDITNMIRLQKGEVTSKELIVEYQKRWKVA
jgi:hypothetical protein